MRANRLCLVGLSLTCLVTVSEAEAQAPPEWEQLAGQGLVAHDAEDWEESRRLFLAAHEVWPAANNLRYAAAATEHLGRRVEAIGYLERALTIEGQHAFRRDQRQIAIDQLEGLRRQVGQLTLRTDPGAAVSVDGAAVDASRPVWVEPGPRVVRVELDGRQTERTVQAYADRVSPVTVMLPTVGGAGPNSTEERAGDATEGPQSRDEQETARDRSAGDSSVGGDAVAAWVATGVFGATTLGTVIWQRDRSAALDVCQSTITAADCTTESEEAIQGEVDTALAVSAAFGGLTLGSVASALTLTFSESEGFPRAAPLLIAGGVGAVGAIIFGAVMGERNGALDECASIMCSDDQLSAIRDERNTFMFMSMLLAGTSASLLSFGLASFAHSSGGRDELSDLRCGAGLGVVTCRGRF